MLKDFGLSRFLYLALGAIGLFLVYFFQHYLDFHSVLFQFQPPKELNYTSDFVERDNFPFVINKVGRYLLNDLFTIAIIYGLFYEKKYLRFAFAVLLFGLIFLLPIYLFLYLSQPEGFSSLIGHLHRLVLNPVLMMLLIPAFFYQKKLQDEKL